MKKGFTLIELLGVIVILGILVLVAFPPLLNQIKNSKNEIKESTKLLIIDSAKDYYEDNKKNYQQIEGISYCINVSTLTEQNYLNEKIKDENLDDIKTEKQVKMIYHNNKFDYELVNECTYYTITFDTDGGLIDTETKQVLENSVYGELPTPTKEGYTFVGWNGKNKAKDINEENYHIIHYNNRTTSEMLLENNIPYIRVNGNNSNGYIDTLWRIVSNEIIEFVQEKNYTLSFNVRSQNSKTTQYIKKREGATDGKTGLYKYANNPNEMISNIESDFNFDNDGNWHYFTSKLTIPENITSGLLVIGNDAPNINGEGSYIDITKIQLEEGTEATEYEPYIITSKTKVTRNYDHTLKAIWKVNE